MDPFKDIWEDAVEKYEAQSQRKVDKDITFRKYTTVNELEKDVNQRTENFVAFRGQHGKLLSKVSKCFQALLPILDVAQKGVGASPYAPAAIAFGAASYLLQACEKVTNCYDAVEELFDQIANVTMRFKEYEHENMEASLKTKLTQVFAFILEIIGKTEKVLQRKRVKQWARSLFLKDDEVSPSLKKLRTFADDELGLAVALTYNRVVKVQDNTEDTRKVVAEIQIAQQTDRLQTFNKAEEERIGEALKTEATSQISRKHQLNTEALTKGTGLWIKEDPMFREWEKEKAPILWVWGRPGVGKTMLATRTIEVLKADFPQHPDIPSLTSVSYFYFDKNRSELNNCMDMWKTAAAQIVASNERFKKHVLSVLKKNDPFTSPRRAWELLFLDFFTENSSAREQTSLAFIIVDGLDEAPEQEKVGFLACLAELVKRTTEKTRCRIQIAMFARPEVKAISGFDKIGSYRSGDIVVTPDRNSEDIGAFVKQNLKEVRVLKILHTKKATKAWKQLRKDIQTAVQDRSQGMFLWASLVFDQIRDLPSAEAIKASLAHAPQGLDDMLHHVFKRFDTDEQMQQSYLHDLLAWVLHAYRALYVSELFVLLRLTADQECVSIKHDLQGRYSSIFDVTGPSGDEFETANLFDLDETNEASDDDFDSLDEDDDHSEADASREDFDEDQVLSDTSDDNAQAAGNMISDNWRNSRVTFTHARVREFLTTECNPKTRQWHDISVFNQDWNESKLRIFRACIEILQTKICSEYNVPGLRLYASLNWVNHLMDIDFGKPGSSLSIALSRNLANLFSDGATFLETSFGYMDDFTMTWFETNQYSQAVRELISQNVEHLDERHRAWALRVKESTRALFEALVSTCATTWLTKLGWDDPGYLDKSQWESWILYAFNSLTDEGVDESHAPCFEYPDVIPLRDMEAIANLLSIPKTEHWYTGVAWIMMEANQPEHTKRAMEYFQKAIDMGGDAWVALEGLAVCHGTNLGQSAEAVQLMKEAISKLPTTEDFIGIDFHLRAKMGSWQLQLPDPEETLQATRAAYELSLEFEYPNGSVSDHHTLLTIKNYLEAIYVVGHYHDIIRFLQDLDSRITYEEQRSLWIVFLRAQITDDYDAKIFAKLRNITHKLGKDLTVPLIQGSAERVVPLDPESIADPDNLWLSVRCLTWLHEMSEAPDHHISVCERLVKLIDQTDETVQQRSFQYRDAIAAILAGYYLVTAIAAKSAGRDSNNTISMLEGLAYHQQGGKRYVRASYPALCMGQWLHEYAGAKDEEWMAYIRPSVKRALYLLSDNDPWNDQQAYAQLGQALLCAGDVKNACIAIGVTLRPLEEAHANCLPDAEEQSKEEIDDHARNTQERNSVEKAETVQIDDYIELAIDEPDHNGRESLEPENFKYSGFTQIWSCDGCMSSRDKLKDPYKELYQCRICEYVCFCETCFRLLQTNGLEYMACSKTHEHVQVYPVTTEAREITMALIEERYEIQQEWLDRLWNIWRDGEVELARPT